MTTPINTDPAAASLPQPKENPPPSKTIQQQDQSESDNKSSDHQAEVVVYIPIPSLQHQHPQSFPLYHDRHVSYIRRLVQALDQPTSYEGAVTEHLRMSGVYWSWMALALLTPADEEIATLPTTTTHDMIDWVMECYDPITGGFGGNVGQDAHILYTLSAVQILALADRLNDPRLNVDAVTKFCVSLQQDDGSFCGDLVHLQVADVEHLQRKVVVMGGEVDTRFTYCALCTLALLHPQEDLNQFVQLRKAAEYVVACQNTDGGFGTVVGAESHAGQVFCCIGALAIAKSLDLLFEKPQSPVNLSTSRLSSPLERLAWWLSERQVDSGGLNGRSEKQADVCYSWWILTAMSIIGRMNWINADKLAYFICQCQDDQDGGIADRPEDMPDVFHTFFGIAGLSLLGHLHQTTMSQAADGIHGETNRSAFIAPTYRKIDPIFALPTDVVSRLGLTAQVIATLNGTVEDRLRRYEVLPLPAASTTGR